MSKEQENSLELIAKKSFSDDINNIQSLFVAIDWKTYEVASELLVNAGKVIVLGIGKSGIIARKIAATFTSIGLPSVFLHPTDAMHGDIGIISENDCAVFISNSGNTEELLTILPFIKHRVASIIGIIGSEQSQLADHCSVVLNASIKRESCPIGIVPSSSLLTALAVSNALTAAVTHALKLTKDDFAHSHPAGQLGRNLLLTVKSVMISGKDNLPFVHSSMKLKDIIIEMSKKGLGCAIVLSNQGKVEGFITDGDVRRSLQMTDDIASISAQQIMSKNPITIHESALLGEALSLMEDREKKIGVLLVKNVDGECSGVIRLHDIAGRVR